MSSLDERSDERPARPTPDSYRYRIMEIAAAIRRGLEHNLSANDPVRFTLSRHAVDVKDGGGDYVTSDEAQAIEHESAEALIEAFRELPANVQRKIMNGWHAGPFLDASHEDFVEYAAASCYIPCLYLSIDERTKAYWENKRGDAGFMSADAQNLAVQFRLGMTKGQAIEAVDNLRALIDHHWDTLVGNPHANDRKARAVARPESDKQTGWLWEATREGDGAHMGFLVTEPGQLNNVVAFVSTEDLTDNQAFEVATRIAGDLRRTWREPYAIDLRPYGRPDSREPMPGLVYTLNCMHIDEQTGEPIGRGSATPNPWCPIRFQAMADASNRPKEEARHA